MIIDVSNMEFTELNEKIRHANTDVTIEHCLGQRFIGNGQSGNTITINGTTRECTRRLSRWCPYNRKRQCSGCNRRYDE